MENARLNSSAVQERAREIFQKQQAAIARRTSAMFAWLMAAQWMTGIIFALTISPRTWTGALSQTHIHVYAAVFLGGLISFFPVVLAVKHPESILTRHAVAIGQMLTSALLIHLTGGRIETHFHVFGSLAFLAFYRDWRPILTATAVVVLDHGLRGLYWPLSVYGIAAVQPWRFLEHSAWVVFEDIFLLLAIFQSVRDMRGISRHQAELEILNQQIEEKIAERTQKLTEAERTLLQAEKMSAMGQLAAGVAHEINNPLGVILGFAQSMASRLESGNIFELPVKSIEKEAARCRNLVKDLLVFSRSDAHSQYISVDINRPIEDALSLIQAKVKMNSIEVEMNLSKNLPPILANENQVQQITVNLVNNAADAMPKGGTLTIATKTVSDYKNNLWVCLKISDTGTGIPPEIQSKIFEPFFTTKPVGQGTGLGLSLAYEIVQKHSGTIELESRPGHTEFTIKFPALSA